MACPYPPCACGAPHCQHVFPPVALWCDQTVGAKRNERPSLCTVAKRWEGRVKCGRGLCGAGKRYARSAMNARCSVVRASAGLEKRCAVLALQCGQTLSRASGARPWLCSVVNCWATATHGVAALPMAWPRRVARSARSSATLGAGSRRRGTKRWSHIMD